MSQSTSVIATGALKVSKISISSLFTPYERDLTQQTDRDPALPHVNLSAASSCSVCPPELRIFDFPIYPPHLSNRACSIFDPNIATACIAGNSTSVALQQGDHFNCHIPCFSRCNDPVLVVGTHHVGSGKNARLGVFNTGRVIENDWLVLNRKARF